MSDKLQGIVDQIKELTLLEASQLVKLMEETFGVSAAAAAVAMPAAGAAVGLPPERLRRRLKRRLNLTSFFRPRVATRSTLSRLFVKSRHWDLRKRRIWSRPLQRLSRKVFPRKKRRPSDRSSRMPGRPSKLSNYAFS